MTAKRNRRDAMRELMERVQTEGIEAAYEAALAICRDKSAPAPARATASTTLFRVAGLFDKRDADPAGKEAHEMTADEIAAAIAEIQSRLSSSGEEDDGPADLFG